MFKFLLILLIIVAVVAYFAARQGGNRPPRDDRSGPDDPGPIVPMGSIGQDIGRKPANDPAPDSTREPALNDSGSSDAGGGDGGGGGD